MGAAQEQTLEAAEPSGRLAETVPLRLEDSPSSFTYPGAQLHVRYGEGLLVGSRGHDQLGHDVAFPFGLSYPTFRYESMDVRCTEEGLEAEIVIANIGSRDGREVESGTETLAEGRTNARTLLDLLMRSNLERPEIIHLFMVLAAESLSADHPAHYYFGERLAPRGRPTDATPGRIGRGA
ncbi:glycoside hydrolase family 3 C-terminal domain-containing protein [Rathayibacter festucae]|uniref:Uncharacterized protein n=1 Tax=Rathayibacter festucae TaxID=110937 RepID=A0ABX6GZ55_9MICO|nr:hypothetical protein [Rathayibacter festucae]MCJ1701806.1 glycoside hydrolase family 3 C-terminal domain-containing protein [Rathayibacter festucae]QHC62829.1 hypothetical protein GSU69_09140 [Rathayibacter festucae]